jgi:hypothetical protein
MPRIFDTKNPGTEKAGDPSLGAPNKRCSRTGPGIGEGGEPDEDNNSLMQAANTSPRSVFWTLLKQPRWWLSMRVAEMTLAKKAIKVPILGVNSFQVMKIDIERVRLIKVTMTGGGTVTFIKFCSEPILTPPPTRSPATPCITSHTLSPKATPPLTGPPKK